LNAAIPDDRCSQPQVYGGFVAYAPPALRRLTLAVAVLYDVDLFPRDCGLVLTGPREVCVEWDTISAVVDAAGQRNTPAPGSGEEGEDRGREDRGREDRGREDRERDTRERDTRERSQLDALAGWLKARREVEYDAQLVALGFPVRHPDHPGRSWVREVIPGDALSLGFGYGPGHLPLPAGVLEHAGANCGAAWSGARDALDRLGELAAQRDRRRIRAAILPLGGADVVTLLGAASLRRELAAGEGDGMAAMIVPLRTRGWRATFASDPAYGPALAAAMPPHERGFDRPLLVTAEEIIEVRAGGDPMRLLRGGTHD
jgi:hypothetical protein